MSALILVVICVLSAVPEANAMGKKSELFSAGVRTSGNVIGKYESLQVTVWYPSVRNWREEYRTTIAGWTVRADRNARPAKGLFPVIIISHDVGKGRFASHDLASVLAENGFVVIAPSHNGDSAQDAMALFSAASLYHRPMQLAGAYSTILNDPNIGPMLDTGRIGLIGVGSGALTVMQSLGVDIDESAVGRLCENGQTGGLCSAWVRERLLAMPADIRTIRSTRGATAFIGAMPSVKAVAFQTPGWLPLLKHEVAGKTNIQAAVVLAERDEQYPLPDAMNQQPPLFPEGFFRTLDWYTVKGADHNALAAEIPTDVVEMLPELQGTVLPEKAVSMRQRRDSFLVAFFQAVLGTPIIPVAVNPALQEIATDETSISDGASDEGIAADEAAADGAEATNSESLQSDERVLESRGEPDSAGASSAP